MLNNNHIENIHIINIFFFGNSIVKVLIYFIFFVLFSRFFFLEKKINFVSEF